MNKRAETACKSNKTNKVLSLIFILFIIELIYMSSSREKMNRDYELFYKLNSLTRTYQKIDTLFNTKGSYQSFDTIVQNTKDFSNILSSLQKYSLFNEEKEHSEINRLYMKLQNDFELSQTYIERYKSWSGVTINSTRAVYDTHGYLKKRLRNKDSTDKEHNAEELLDEIIFMLAFISYDKLSDSKDLKQKVQNLKDSFPGDISLQKSITTLDKHIRVLLDGHVLMQRLKVKNETLELVDSIDKIYTYVLQDFQKKDQSTKFNIYILNGLVFLLLLFLFLTNKKEFELHQEVCVLNYELEENIDEVESMNKEMKILFNTYDTHIIASETDLNGIIGYVSTAFCDVSGYSKEELIGQSHNIVRHPDTPKEVYKDMWRTIKAGKEWTGEMKNRNKDGSFYWVDIVVSPEFDKDKNITGFSAVRHVITSKKELESFSHSLEEKVYSRTKELEEMVKKVEKLSVTDELTSLYNRRYYAQIIKNEIKRAQRRKVIFGYLVLDIDNFKLYNDNYGHQLGDTVLQKISKSFISALERPDDVVFRMGGEEFLVIFTGETREKIIAFAQKIRENIYSLEIEHAYNKPYGVITVSGGLVLCEPEMACPDEDLLYKISDELLYEAKEAGRNCLKV